ncbi:Glycerol-4-phosphate dehydrogenase [Pseudomonas sp. 9Ag]|uniref:Uncharacterized protein n=1 Tax=Stutzerimonas stutzeri TaxID=316 RepID=A0A5S5BEV5_STUST|nr:hypothetical protein A9A72_122625 [Stutzerimonas stutzeri]VXC80473.1 Glycerol-4-phosphate dehydrogenase [Pseudomonas sp. 9Ag]
MHVGIPNLPGPASSTQHGAQRQALTNPRTHPVATPRCTTRAITLAYPIKRSRNWQPEPQAGTGKTVKHLVSDRDVKKIEVSHGRLA